MDEKALIGFDSEWCHCGCGYYMACIVEPEGGAQITVWNQIEAADELSSYDGYDYALHNGKADLSELGYWPVTGTVYDSMILSWVYDENGKHGLKHLAETILHRKLEDPIRVKDGVTEFKVGARYVHIADAPQELVEQYCRADAIASRDLVIYYWHLLNSRQKDWYIKSDSRFLKVLWEMERRGIAIDLDLLAKETYAMGSIMKEAEERAYEIAGYEFNINSAQQLGNVLFTNEWTTKVRKKVGVYSTGRDKIRWCEESRSGFGIKPVRFTAGGAPSTDDESLEPLDHELAETVLDYRAAAKIKSTYLEAFPRYTGQDGRLRGTFNPAGTVTGRLSSADPNLQNVPARGELGGRVRKLFVAGEGRALLVADLDQLENRIIASLSGEEGLIEAFLNGEDVHQRTADMMGGVSRHVGKTLNYAVAYGATAKRVSSLLKCSKAEASEYIEKYKAALPAVEAWKKKVLAFARKHRAVATLDRRLRRLPDINHKDRGIRFRAERQAVNAVIQGSAADVVRLWMLQVNSNIETRGTMLLQVHDEIVCEVSIDNAEKACYAVVNELETVNEYYGLKVPFTTTPKVVERWSEAK